MQEYICKSLPPSPHSSPTRGEEAFIKNLSLTLVQIFLLFFDINNFTGGLVSPPYLIYILHVHYKKERVFHAPFEYIFFELSNLSIVLAFNWWSRIYYLNTKSSSKQVLNRITLNFVHHFIK